MSSAGNPASDYGYENEMDRQSDAAYNARQSVTEAGYERQREANRFASGVELNGGVLGMGAGSGLRFGRAGYGLQVTPGAMAAMNDGITDARGDRMLRAMRDADIDAAFVAQKAQQPTVAQSGKPQYLSQSEIDRESYLLNARSVGNSSSALAVTNAPKDSVGNWIKSLNLPEIPGVGWLSRDQALSSAQYWQGRLDETGRPIYALAQGVANLWADHSEEVGMALSIRGGTKGVMPGESGAFGTLKGVKGDGLTAHHIPQAAGARTGYSEGGALVLNQAEHVATRTYGSKGIGTLQADAGLSFRQVLARDIADVRSLVGSKYNEGLRNLTEYYRKNFPELMGK